MRFIPAEISGVVLIEPDVFGDARGFFLQSYHKGIFSKNGITVEFVQDNHSASSKGVLRGLHYQQSPHAQGKLVRAVRGRVFDVVVDIRKGSPTFGRHVSQILSEENKKMVYVPPGFAHGFLALDDHTEFLYKVTAPYSPADERGVIWNDPSLGISWPVIDAPYILSEKDQNYPLLKDAVL
jgi:dTDP-4-dehydrorhamnose 3,5-epimerase